MVGLLTATVLPFGAVGRAQFLFTMLPSGCTFPRLRPTILGLASSHDAPEAELATGIHAHRLDPFRQIRGDVLPNKTEFERSLVPVPPVLPAFGNESGDLN